MYKVQLIPSAEIESIIPLLMILDPNMQPDTLSSRLTEMIQHNYQCVGVYDGDKLIGISGIWVLYKYYMGKHIEPDNVCILPEYRDKGVGELMIKWIYDYAVDIGCNGLELNCYVTNSRGVKFWHNHGYRIVGFHFQQKLKE